LNVVAIDTATDACSVALAMGDEVLSDHRIAPRQHARLLLSMIDALLTKGGLARGDLDGIVFGQGPGSFTGLRVAASVTQGIALGLDIGVIGVSSLAGIAQGCYREFGDRSIGVALDARLDEVYWGAYQVMSGPIGDEERSERHSAVGRMVVACTEERVCRPDAIDIGVEVSAEVDIESGADVRVEGGIVDAVKPSTGEWSLVGSGAERYETVLAKSLGASLSSRLRPGRLPQARDLLTLAAPRIARREFLPAEAAVPVYLRERVALTEAERSVVNARSR